MVPILIIIFIVAYAFALCFALFVAPAEYQDILTKTTCALPVLVTFFFYLYFSRFTSRNIQRYRKHHNQKMLINAVRKGTNVKEAIEALFFIGSPPVAPFLALTQSPEFVNYPDKGSIIQALGRMQEQSATEELIRLLEDPAFFKSASGFSKYTHTKEILIALGNTGSEKAVPPLLEKLDQSDYGDDVTRALQQIGKPAVVPLIKAYSQSPRSYLTLKGMGEAAVPALLEELQQPAFLSRLQVIKLLGEIGSPLALEALLPFLTDTDKQIRLETIQTLSIIKDPRAVGSLKECLKDAEPGLRAAAAKALSTLHWVPDMEDEYGAWYWAAQNDIEKCAAYGEPALPLLLPFLSDPNARLRARTLKAVEQLGWQPGSDPISIRYWIAERNTEQCIALGTLCVEPLIQLLQDTAMDASSRTFAAQALVGIYQQTGDVPLREKILSLRETVGSTHQDRSWQGSHHSDIDYGDRNSDCSGHDDQTSYYTEHTDEGKTVEFPL